MTIPLDPIESYNAMKKFVSERLYPKELAFHDITSDYLDHVLPVLNIEDKSIYYLINSYANSVDKFGQEISFLFEGSIQNIDKEWTINKLEIKEQKGKITERF